MLTIYFIVYFLFISLLAYRKFDDMRTGALFATFWPISIPALIFILVLEKIHWDINIELTKKLYNWRKPNDNWPGFAITIFYCEFQFWKTRK